jgi:hypothetical protein
VAGAVAVGCALPYNEAAAVAVAVVARASTDGVACGCDLVVLFGTRCGGTQIKSNVPSARSTGAGGVATGETG